MILNNRVFLLADASYSRTVMSSSYRTARPSSGTRHPSPTWTRPSKTTARTTTTAPTTTSSPRERDWGRTTAAAAGRGVRAADWLMHWRRLEARGNPRAEVCCIRLLELPYFGFYHEFLQTNLEIVKSLICGLPLQTNSKFLKSIRTINSPPKLIRIFFDSKNKRRQNQRQIRSIYWRKRLQFRSPQSRAEAG